MKKMREARKGDRALVLPDPDTLPGLEYFHGQVIEVLSDPEERPCLGSLGICMQRSNMISAYVEVNGLSGSAWHSTALLIPIDPDDDTRRQFEEEAAQDRIDKVRKTADALHDAMRKARGRA